MNLTQLCLAGTRMTKKMRQLFQRVFVLSVLSFVWTVPSQADVILHAFNWSYRSVGEQAQEIAQLGYKYVMVAPAMKSVGGLWWARYQPQDYRVIDHPLGNKEDFDFMIAALAEYDVKVLADIVFNHMANEANVRNTLDYPGESILDLYSDRRSYYESQKLFGDLSDNFLSGFDFHDSGCIQNYFDIFQVQTGRICGGPGDSGLPDLQPNDWVIQQQRNYLQALKDAGVAGFRVDAAKHMELEHINQVFTADIMSGTLTFGEVITYGGSDTTEYRLFLEPYLRFTRHLAYDFPLLTLTKRALGPGGRMDSLVTPYFRGQALSPDRSILVATTHDIANSQFDFFIMPEDDERLAYAYILSIGQGIPMVYSEPEDPGRPRWKDYHRRTDLQAMIYFHNTTEGQGLEYLRADECILLIKRGKLGLAGINKCSADVVVDLDLARYFGSNQTLQNLLRKDADLLTSSGGNVAITIPARAAEFWLNQ